MSQNDASRDLALTLSAMALEHAYGVPWVTLAKWALEPNGPGLEELAMLGAALFIDYVRIARGEISSAHIPRRLPRRGETPRNSWELLLTLTPSIPPLRREPTPNEVVDFGAIRAALWEY